MKITKETLKQLIAEELQRELNEGTFSGPTEGTRNQMGLAILNMKRQLGIIEAQMQQLIGKDDEMLVDAAETLHDAVSTAKSVTKILKMVKSRQ